MGTPVESFVTATTRSQEATTSALRSWADGLQAFSGGSQSALSDLPTMIGQYFDAVQQVLDGQRQFAETMVSVLQTTQTFTNQAARAAEDTVNAVHSAANGVASVTKAAKEQTSAVARATKAATS
jgi:methyl-accepting chemotaxis protein